MAAKKSGAKKKAAARTSKPRVRKPASRVRKPVYDPSDLATFMHGLERRNESQPEFLQAVREVANDVFPFVKRTKQFTDKLILERMTEPDRVLVFRVTWEDDAGHMRINRGFRVQFNNSIGPYKGGLRYHPSVNLSIIKFLAFEQTLKNALTTLPLGSAKGGSDFNPRGKSDSEILRFCKSFMLELYRFIGPNLDVPAGDIGVGSREIGYLFGQYKRLTGEHASGTITGKGLEYGGSLIRTEATGFGAVYFAENMLRHHGLELAGKRCTVSGSGNVALHCALKLIQSGSKVLTLSDSSGFVHDPAGIDETKLNYVMELKTVRRGSISEFAKEFGGVRYYPGKRPWGVKCDLAFPCATQNELDITDAEQLLKNKCIAVIEGANMPATEKAQKLLRGRLMLAPAKAANAGGVAISGLEMSQNTMRFHWTEKELDMRLREIMASIHSQCVEYGQSGKRVDYISGANLAGFVRVGKAMLAQGV